MKELDQNQAPIYEALVKLRKKRIVPFDVPGHKRGRGNPELVELLGEKCVGIDVNSMKPLDNLGHPISIIRGCRGAGGGCFWSSPCFSNDRGNNLIGADYDSVNLQGWR